MSANDTYTCACPYNEELDIDQHTCVKNKKVSRLAIGLFDRILIRTHNEFGRHEDGTGHELPIIVSEMAYNTLTGDIFVVDNVEGYVYSYDAYAENVDNMLRKLFGDFGNITALAFGKQVAVFFEPISY